MFINQTGSTHIATAHTFCVTTMCVLACGWKFIYQLYRLIVNIAAITMSICYGVGLLVVLLCSLACLFSPLGMRCHVKVCDASSTERERAKSSYRCMFEDNYYHTGGMLLALVLSGVLMSQLNGCHNCIINLLQNPVFQLALSLR